MIRVGVEVDMNEACQRQALPEKKAEQGAGIVGFFTHPNRL